MVYAIGNDTSWAYADAGSLGVGFAAVKRHVDAQKSDHEHVRFERALGEQKLQQAQALIETADMFTTLSPAVSNAMYAEARPLIDQSIHHRANHSAVFNNKPYEEGYTDALRETFASGVPKSLVRDEPLIAAFAIQKELDADVPLGQISVFDRSRDRVLSTEEISEFAAWDGETEVEAVLNGDVSVTYGDRTAIQRFDGEENSKITQEWVWHPINQEWESGALTIYMPGEGTFVDDNRNPENNSRPRRAEPERSAYEIMQEHYDPEGNYNSYPNSLPPNFQSNRPSDFDGYPDTDAIPDALSSFFGFPGLDGPASTAGTAYTIFSVLKSGIDFSTFAVPLAAEALESADRYDGKPTVEGPNPGNMFNGLPHDHRTRHLYADN